MNHRNSVKALAITAFALALALLSGCSMFEKTGTVTGTIYDSTASGSPLGGVRVTVLNTSHSATTDSSGVFTIDAPEGTATLHFALTGYMFVDITVEVVADQTVTASDNIVAYHQLTAGQYRFVLSWGSTPSDLDSHLLLPVGSEDVYWAHKNAANGHANLDWDDTTSFGPETITITTVDSGTYNYSVYNYSGSPDMGANSSAVVQVYDSTGLIKTLKITDAPGASSSTDRWWDVFSFNAGSFIYYNQMSPVQP